jgi:microcystin-dependent protein
MEAFLGQIVMFGSNFAPRSWAFCDGQLIAISQNAALFSLLGTIYGGDGRTTFALPDMRGRVPVHPGNGSGLSQYQLGARGGTENTTLTVANLPAHTHDVRLVDEATEERGEGHYLANGHPNYGSGTPSSTLSREAVANTGGGQYFNNIQPYLCVNFIIALYGTFPSRN